jgi:hypothetical protein
VPEGGVDEDRRQGDGDREAGDVRRVEKIGALVHHDRPPGDQAFRLVDAQTEHGTADRTRRTADASIRSLMQRRRLGYVRRCIRNHSTEVAEYPVVGCAVGLAPQDSWSVLRRGV